MIEALDLTKDYGSFRAVDRVRFQVQKGDVLGFLGPNGAGKSTTMKMITGFLAPTAGTAKVGGHDIRAEPMAAKRLFGYLPENGPLYQEMTVLEFLRFIAEIRGSTGAARGSSVTRVLEMCHLEPVRHQTIETLSKGFRQRVGMAQALIHDPSCLIMDEPTDGLDPNQKREVRKLIAGMGRDKAIILSTHILEEVQAMCNRVIIIAAGRVLVDESPDDLLKRHPHFGAVRVSVQGTDAASLQAILSRIPEVMKVESVPKALLVYPRNHAELKPILWQAAREQNWSVTEIESAPVRLEDVFASLTQRNASSEASTASTPASKDPAPEEPITLGS